MAPGDLDPQDTPQEEAKLVAFGVLLCRLRNRANLSLRDLADDAGRVTAQYLAILEKGKNPKTGNPSRPTLELVLRLSRALNLSFDEASELANYAGYEISTVADRDAVASVLANKELPQVFTSLRLLETDLHRFVSGKTLVEAPIFTILAHFDRSEAPNWRPIYITGLAFRAQGQPARLYALKSKLKARSDLQRTLFSLRKLLGEPETSKEIGSFKVTVQGQFMTPTVLLLYCLSAANLPFKVHNEYLDVDFSSRDGKGPVVEIEVVYSPDAQELLLKHGTADLALMVHPFKPVQDNPEQFERALDLDLWTAFRDAELPMSLITTTPETFESHRSDLVSQMDRLRLSYQLFFDKQVGLARHALKENVSYGFQDFDDAVLETPSDVYLDEVQAGDIADGLSVLSHLGYQLNVLNEHKPPTFYRRFIKAKSDLVSVARSGTERLEDE